MRKMLVLIVAVVLCITTHAQDQNISGGLFFEGEPYLAINPTNPQHMVVAWMGFVPFARVSIKVKTTFDGGRTWSSPTVLPHRSGTYTSADVSMAFDHNGNLFAAYIDYRQSPDSGGVFISRSTDGGLTWSYIGQAIDAYADGSKRPLDRPWLVIGRQTGSTQDTMYITTKPAPWIPAPNRPYFVKSVNGGTTWSNWKYVDSNGYRVGNFIQAPMATPAVDSAGIFHCVYPTYNPADATYPRLILTSPGNTSSFRYNTVYNIAGWGTNDTLAKTSIHLSCDPTKNSHYAFFTGGTISGDMDIYCLETTDGGNTWSTPVRVNGDAAGTGKMQDMAWSAFDNHGNLVAAWRDRRNAPGSGYAQAAEIWGAVKWKDSTSFSANFRISDTLAQYDSTYLYGSGNDFMGVVMANDTLSAVWGDVRTGVLNIWFSRRALRSGVTTTIVHLVQETVPQISAYPNPANEKLTVTGFEMRQISLLDATGKALFQTSSYPSRAEIDTQQIPNGTYVLKITTGEGVTTRKILIQH